MTVNDELAAVQEDAFSHYQEMIARLETTFDDPANLSVESRVNLAVDMGASIAFERLTGAALAVPAGKGEQCPRSEACTKPSGHRGGCYPKQRQVMRCARDWVDGGCGVTAPVGSPGWSMRSGPKGDTYLLCPEHTMEFAVPAGGGETPSRDEIARALNRAIGGALDLDMTATDGAHLLQMAADAILALFAPVAPIAVQGDGDEIPALVEKIKLLHAEFGPSNYEESNYNAGAHEAIGQVLDLLRAVPAVQGEGDDE